MSVLGTKLPTEECRFEVRFQTDIVAKVLLHGGSEIQRAAAATFV